MYADFFHGVFGSPCFLFMVVNVFARVGINISLLTFANQETLNLFNYYPSFYGVM